MTKTVNCDQLIEGKLINSLQYQIVAHSPNLTDHNDFFKQVFHYRFWGLQQPNYDNCQAAGYIYVESYLILIQVAPALDHLGEYLLDSKGRLFNQHRYILIPENEVKSLQTQIFYLLGWIFDQPIPIFQEFEPNLKPLTLNFLTDKQSFIEKNLINKLKFFLIQSLKKNQKQSLLLLAISALINNYRILLTLEGENSPDDFLESILSLFPASIRPKISVAVGIIDQEYCNWAKILIKTNHHHLGSKITPQVLWFKRDQEKIIGNYTEVTLKSIYVDYILTNLIDDEAELRILLECLNQIEDSSLTLESLNNVETIIKFIPLLPEVKQAKIWDICLKNLSLEKWENFSQLIKTPLGLVCGWKILINQFNQLDLQNQNISEQQLIIQNLINIWQQLPSETKINLLKQILQEQTRLTQEFLLYLLKDSHNIKNLDQKILAELRIICQKLINHLLEENVIIAWQYANQLSQSILFDDQKDQTQLLDQVLASVIDLFKLQYEQLLNILNQGDKINQKQVNLMNNSVKCETKENYLLLENKQKEYLQTILIDILTKQILPKQQIELLQWWQNNLADHNLYAQAFTIANQQYLPTISIYSFVNYVKLLKQHSLVKESQIVLNLAFSDNLPQNIIYEINNYLT